MVCEATCYRAVTTPELSKLRRLDLIAGFQMVRKQITVDNGSFSHANVPGFGSLQSQKNVSINFLVDGVVRNFFLFSARKNVANPCWLSLSLTGHNVQ